MNTKEVKKTESAKKTIFSEKQRKGFAFTFNKVFSSLSEYFKSRVVFEPKNAKSIFDSSLIFIMGFVLSFAQIGGISPFSMAFSRAILKSEKYNKRRLFSFVGILLSCFFIQNGVFHFAAALTSFLVGEIFYIKSLNFKGKNNKSFEKSIVISSFVSSVFFIPLGFFETFIFLFSTLFFSISFVGLFHQGKQTTRLLYDLGFMCLAFSLTSAFSGLSLGYLSFGMILAVFFTLEGAEKGGYYLGTFSGFASGLALGAEYVVPFFVCGLISGAIIRKRQNTSLFLLLIFTLVYSFAFFEKEKFLVFFISVLWGSVLWLSATKLFLWKNKVRLPIYYMEKNNAEAKRLSGALYSVSLAFDSISKAKKREREEKTRLVIEGIFSEECETCEGCKYPTEGLKKHLCHNMMKNKKVTERDFSDEFISECTRCGFIRDKINSIIDKEPLKTSLRIDSLAEDYMSLAKIIALGEKRAENKYYKDAHLAREIKLSLELKKIHSQNVEVRGTRLPFVEITGIPFKIPFSEKTILSETSKILKKDMEISSFEVEGKKARISLETKPPLGVECYKISIPKKGEIICGDSTTVFYGEDGFFYSLISDGMGSGRDAAVCSRLGTVFLEKLITAGIDKGGAVSMLGNVISASEDEVFTTVDLAEIDLVRGKITFLKGGAAPSYIIREGRAYSVKSKTLPCGIIPKSPVEQTIIDCFSGDVLIMASDGGEWAEESLSSLSVLVEKNFPSSKAIASFLADEAVKKSGRVDDISFCVVSIL